MMAELREEDRYSRFEWNVDGDVYTQEIYLSRITRERDRGMKVPYLKHAKNK
jgi:hypothetical protein